MKDSLTMNKYDYAIVALIGSLLFGGIGGYLTVSRILTLLFIPLFLKKIKQNKILNVIVSVKTLVVFYLYCVLTIIWTPNKTEGIKELIYYLIHFIYFLEIISFSLFAKKPTQSISIGWLMVVLGSTLIGLFELVTDIHFGIGQESDRAMNFGGTIIKQRFARGLFVNYNTLVTVFLTYILSLYYKTRARGQRFLCFFTVFLSFIVVVTNASRGGILSYSIIILFSFLFASSLKNKVKTAIVIFILASFVIARFYDLIFGFLEIRLATSDVTSDNTRLGLWTKGIQICFDYFGLGSGVGSVETMLEQRNKGGITYTHNMFIELLCQYGIVFLLVLVRYIWRLFKNVRYVKDKALRRVLYSCFIALPFFMVIDSGYLLYPQLFAFFASLSVYIFVLSSRNSIKR